MTTPAAMETQIMSESQYSIDPNYVVPEPTPADFFSTVDDPGTTDARMQIVRETFDRWREDGIQQGRVTLIEPDDETNLYPPGLWIEGWKDGSARQLPFGAGYPDENSPSYPPLTACVP